MWGRWGGRWDWCRWAELVVPPMVGIARVGVVGDVDSLGSLSREGSRRGLNVGVGNQSRSCIPDLIVEVYHELFLLERQNPLQFGAELLVLVLLDKSRGENFVEVPSHLLVVVAVRGDDERTWSG